MGRGTVTNDSFDIAVVGAGAAGCVVASRLAAASERSIILLEAGPAMDRPTPTDAADGWRLPVVPDWGFESEPNDAGTTSRLRRGRVLGGTSWLTRFAVRGAAADFEAWADRGNPGWSFADVLPAFRRIEADAEFGDRPWHGDGGPIPITRYPHLQPSVIHAAALEAFDAVGIPRIEDHNEPGGVGAGPMPMSSRNGVRVTSADAYLADGARPPNLAIRTDAMVATVTIEAGRATAVQLDDGTRIRADLIVLAAGTYGSPPILMRSGIGPAGHLGELGIPVRVDLPGVGANLADHPGVELDSGWRGQATDGPILHSIATLRSSTAPSDGPQDLMFWITDPEGAEPGFWFDPVLLKPRSRGSVRLRSADPAAPPRIRLPGLSDTHDIDRLAEGYRLGLELAGQPGIRRHATEAAPPEPSTREAWRRRIVENAYSIPHVVGTCAMGPTPEGGDVVDAGGRVHGVDRLFVVDASIMPDAPSGFPHLITIMLAEHLAETIGRTIV